MPMVFAQLCMLAGPAIMRGMRKISAFFIAMLLSPARHLADVDLMSPQPRAAGRLFRAGKAGPGSDVMCGFLSISKQG